ncbi:hypothetical protein QTO34_006655 [Cnephaeus nilssonii]|uniref:60S acidic ribosomal protein P1 n=1 Tax=Cnephaeus nilssonii TaxID=3371016 RepID=A0AA40LIN4_CNENI|nr:hypothetical protein QTO34_006655 [Eptesicus nilssonii]
MLSTSLLLMLILLFSKILLEKKACCSYSKEVPVFERRRILSQEKGRGSAAKPEAGLTAGKHSSSGGSLSRLWGNAKDPSGDVHRGVQDSERAQSRLRDSPPHPRPQCTNVMHWASTAGKVLGSLMKPRPRGGEALTSSGNQHRSGQHWPSTCPHRGLCLGAHLYPLSLILHKDEVTVREDKISALIKAAGLFAKALANVNIGSLICHVGAGGPAPSTAAASAEEKKVEAKEKESEESDDDADFGLFY